MKTIRRNSTRIIAEIKKSIVSVVFYDQNGGGLKPTTLDAAMEDLYRFDFSKLYDNGDGKYTVHVHSNLWYYLFTQDHLDRVNAENAARAARQDARDAERNDQKRAWRPMRVRDSRDNTVYVFEGIGGPSVWLSDPADTTRHSQWVTWGEFTKYFEAICENGNNHQVETCPGCGTEDADGNQIDEPAITVTVTRTRMAIGEQIAQACEALGIELGHGWSKGAAHYEVNGKIYTAGELADLVLEGGFAANYGGNEVRVNWNSPLVLAKGSVERMGVNVVMLRALQAELKDPRAIEGVGKAAQIMLDTLHGWAIEDAPREKVDFPSGAAEPGKDVTAVQCARTGEIFTRTGSWWTQKRTGLQATWYQMNITDPMSEGFRIYREGSR